MPKIGRCHFRIATSSSPAELPARRSKLNAIRSTGEASGTLSFEQLWEIRCSIWVPLALPARSAFNFHRRFRSTNREQLVALIVLTTLGPRIARYFTPPSTAFPFASSLNNCLESRVESREPALSDATGVRRQAVVCPRFCPHSLNLSRFVTAGTAAHVE